MALSPAAFAAGTELFHATPATNRDIIAASGLLPRNPAWSQFKSPDASKDGFLSMATTERGAGAMGGTQIMLKIPAARASALGMRFRQMIGSTEVRTTSAIPASELKIRIAPGEGEDKWDWLVARPAAAAAAAPAGAAAAGAAVAAAPPPAAAAANT